MSADPFRDMRRQARILELADQYRAAMARAHQADIDEKLALTLGIRPEEPPAAAHLQVGMSIAHQLLLEAAT